MIGSLAVWERMQKQQSGISALSENMWNRIKDSKSKATTAQENPAVLAGEGLPMITTGIVLSPLLFEGLVTNGHIFPSGSIYALESTC